MTDENTTKKIGEIFITAGQAFSKLAELTMQLNPEVEAPPGSKWTEDEIEMLRNAIQSFGMDLNKISEVVKTRSITQLKNAIKRKIYVDAGVPVSKNQQQAKKRPNEKNSDSAQCVAAETVPFDHFSSTLSTDGTKRLKLNGKSKAETDKAEADDPVKVENVDNSQNALKKLDRFMSTPVRGVSDLFGNINQPPPLPPFDLVSDPS